MVVGAAQGSIMNGCCHRGGGKYNEIATLT